MRLLLNSGPDGGECPPVGDCRGFNGTCGELPRQFATVAVMPDYPNGLQARAGGAGCAGTLHERVLTQRVRRIGAQDYTCTAFPNDASRVDSFIVGLIALAVAIPVTLFITTCFAVANDNEAPDSWLEWSGWMKLLLGLNAHRRWHYTRGAPPRRFVQWYIRSVTEPPSETAANLVHSLHAWATGTETPWAREARELREAQAEAACAESACAAPAEEEEELERWSEGPHDTTRSVRRAHTLSAHKRRVMLLGLAAALVCWAIFTWFVFTCACAARMRRRVACGSGRVALTAPRSRATDGMLIFRLLGEDAEQSFARSWGVSYGISAASEARRARRALRQLARS